MSKCNISIIIPAYNVEKYLNEALNSVGEQSEFPDEVILIDDGSTDQTLKIAESYEFPFIYKVISIENCGQGNARNIGARLASSEYIYYFDSDDILDKDFIKSMKANIKSNNFPDIVLFSGQTFNDKNYKGDRWVNYDRGFSGFYEQRSDFLDQGFAHRSLFCSPCLYVSKRSLWGRCSLRFESYYLEDEAIFYTLLFSCKSFLVIDKVFFYRRNRDASTMTMQPNLKHVKGALNCIKSTVDLYYTKKLTKREYWHLRKRLEMQCLTYISLAKKTKQRVSYKKLVGIIIITKNTVFLAKIPLYLIGVNEVNFFQKVSRILKLVS